MEGHGAKTNYDIPQEDQDKHLGMGVGNDISQALDSKPHKHQVRERVDQLGAVKGDVVILECSVSIVVMGDTLASNIVDKHEIVPLHTNSASRSASPRTPRGIPDRGSGRLMPLPWMLSSQPMGCRAV